MSSLSRAAASTHPTHERVDFRPDAEEGPGAAKQHTLPPPRTMVDLRERLVAFAPSKGVATQQFLAAFGTSALACGRVLPRGPALDAALGVAWLGCGPLAAWTISWPLVATTTQQLRGSKALLWPMVGLNYGQIVASLALRGSSSRRQTLDCLPAYVVLCGFPQLLHFLPPIIATRTNARQAKLFQVAISAQIAAAVAQASLRQLRGYLDAQQEIGGADAPRAVDTSALKAAETACQLACIFGVLMLGARGFSLSRQSQQTHGSVNGFKVVQLSIAVGCVVAAGLLVQTGRELL